MATKKWQESDFCKMSPVHSADTVQVQDFVKISLSHTVSKINALLRFTNKFKMPLKVAGKRFLQKVASRLCIYSAGPKFRRNRDFCEKSPVHPWGRKFQQNPSTSHG